MTSNSLAVISLSPRYETTWRWRCMPPFLALVMTFSATGRSAFALASVVTMPSAAISEATRLAIMSRWCAASPPNRRPRFGVASMSLAPAEREAPLVELVLDLVERLLAEVRDGQQVVLALAEQLAHGVDLRSLEAVAGGLGQVEVFDRRLEVGRARRRGARLAELQTLRLVAHLGHEGHQLGERVA